MSQGAELRNLREECPGKPHLAGATIMAAGTTTEGVLVLNSLLNPIFVNGAAAQILAYPATFQAQNDLERVLARGPTNPFEGLTISEVCLRLRSIAQSTVTGSTPGAVDGMLFSPRFCRVTAYNKSTIQKN